MDVESVQCTSFPAGDDNLKLQEVVFKLNLRADLTYSLFKREMF